MKSYGLLAVAIVCAIAGFAADRFDYELCHRGIPIAWVAFGLPVAGLAAGLASFMKRPRGLMSIVNIAVSGANLYFLIKAAMVIAGPGYLSC